jgi:hypothetical protein
MLNIQKYSTQVKMAQVKKKTAQVPFVNGTSEKKNGTSAILYGF